MDKRDAYWIKCDLVTIDFLCFVAKMDHIFIQNAKKWFQFKPLLIKSVKKTKTVKRNR